MSIYRLSFKVTEQQLPTIIGVLAKEISSFHISEILDDSQPKSEKTVLQSAASTSLIFPSPLGKSKIASLICNHIKIGERLTYIDGKALLSSFGNKETSFSPLISRLISLGYFSRLQKGLYIRVK